jgi:hypothetical protein
MNITVTKESQNDFKELKECGNIDLREGATAEFPTLETSGDIDLREGATADFPALATSGEIWISEGVTADFPALATSGDIDLREGVTADFPALATSGKIWISKGVTADFPALATSGNIWISKGVTADFPALATSGNIDLREGATADFPALETSGDIWISEGATADFPALETSGNIWISKGATADFPALATSGNIWIREGATLKHTLLDDLYYKSVDNILFVIESQKIVKGITILIGYNLKRFEKGKAIKEHCFVAEKDNFFAHGNTVKKAIEDLNFKIISEKLKNDPISENTECTVKHYRLVTGACDLGVRSWMKSNGLEFEIVGENTIHECTVEKKPILAKDLYVILEKTSAYGFEKFKSLVNFK